MRQSLLLTIGLFSVIALTIASPIALAQSPTLKPIQIRNQQIKEANQERKETVQAARQTYRSDLAKLHASRLERRFEFYAQRLNNILTRIERRAVKEASEGKDVTAVRKKLDEAKTTLTQAIADGKAAVSAFQAIDPAKWAEQSSEVKAAKDLAQKARLGFSTTHKLLMEAIVLLRTN